MTPVSRRITAPVRIAVRGRDGVGRGTVAAALTRAGITIAPDHDGADVQVVVIAEAPKPEDLAMVPADRAGLVVLNKADLSGFGVGGPLAQAHRRAADYRARTGVQTVPMIALLATAAIDDEQICALRTLVAHPADLTSTDAFATAEHPLSTEIRRRLLETLDRFGIAHAVLALGQGVEPAALPGLLHELSQVDRVVAHLRAVSAPIRYRRVKSAIAELRLLATQSTDPALSDSVSTFLSADDTVLAVMASAVDVVEAAGVTVDRGDDADAHLRRAVQWRRYSRGPVDALHRSCGADICRGSLRLLGRPR